MKELPDTQEPVEQREDKSLIERLENQLKNTGFSFEADPLEYYHQATTGQPEENRENEAHPHLGYTVYERKPMGHREALEWSVSQYIVDRKAAVRGHLIEMGFTGPDAYVIAEMTRGGDPVQLSEELEKTPDEITAVVEKFLFPENE